MYAYYSSVPPEKYVAKWTFIVEDPDEPAAPDLATADPVPEDGPEPAPDPEGDD